MYDERISFVTVLQHGLQVDRLGETGGTLIGSVGNNHGPTHATRDPVDCRLEDLRHGGVVEVKRVLKLVHTTNNRRSKKCVCLLRDRGEVIASLDRRRQEHNRCLLWKYA
jgi:hypothetical protein